MHNSGFSILEFITVIAITAISIALAIPNLQRIAFVYLGKTNMHELQQILQFARSLAIAQQALVTVCPSYNGLSCDHNWSRGILVTNPKVKKFFKFNLHNGTLILRQSGSSNSRLQILPSGMLHSNGHFNLQAKQALAGPEFNLYFNKALRMYLKHEF